MANAVAKEMRTLREEASLALGETSQARDAAVWESNCSNPVPNVGAEPSERERDLTSAVSFWRMVEP